MFGGTSHQSYYSFFDPSYVPAVSLATFEGEVGTQFSCDSDGLVTHVRFWKVSGDTDMTHTIRVWDSGGSLLQATPTSGETAAGWQQQELLRPIEIRRGVLYTVSRNVPLLANSLGFIAPFWTAANTRVPVRATTLSGRQTGTQGAYPATNNDTFTGCDPVFFG